MQKDKPDLFDLSNSSLDINNDGNKQNSQHPTQQGGMKKSGQLYCFFFLGK